MEDRSITLLKACRDLLNKQNKTCYVLNLLSETVYYDEVDCDGSCLLDDIEAYLEEVANHKSGNCTNNCEHYDSTVEYIKNRTVDEFAEKLKEQVSSHFRYRGIIEESTEYADYIDEIAEGMKKSN